MVGPLGSGTDETTPQKPPFLLFSNFVWTFFEVCLKTFPRLRKRTYGSSRRASLILESKCNDITCRLVLVLFHSSLVGYGSTTWAAFFGLCGYPWGFGVYLLESLLVLPLSRASAGMMFPTNPPIKVDSVDLHFLSTTHSQAKYLALGGRVDICSHILTDH